MERRSNRKDKETGGMRRACLRVDTFHPESPEERQPRALPFPRACFKRVIAYLVWGIPYLMPTPTRGSALIIFFTVAWSENANRIEAVDKKALRHVL